MESRIKHLTNPKLQPTKRETIQTEEMTHGEKVEPYKEVTPDAGWLVCPENKGYYTGDNAPWRR